MLYAKCLDTFVASEMVRLENDAQARRWHAGQMLRFLVESKAQAEGVNAYEARRGAELMVSAAGEADLRKRLAHLLSFWSAQSLEELLEDTRAPLLSQHPLLGERRITRVAQSLSGQRFQEVFKTYVRATPAPSAFGAYLRSAVLHSLAVSLKESFLPEGRGVDRQVTMHDPLHIHFSQAGDTVTTH